MGREDKDLKQDVEIIELAESALACIEEVGTKASSEIEDFRKSDAGAFTTINTWNSPEQVRQLGGVGSDVREQLEMLAKEPVISRVCYEDEDGKEHVLFISRSSPPSGTSQKVASYRSPQGRLASLPAGAEFELRLGGHLHTVEVKNTAKLHPKKPDGHWDSFSTEIDRGPGRKATVLWLRKLLQVDATSEVPDLVTAMFEAEEPNIQEGLHKATLIHMGLREQPILDQYQDEIFRLPVASQCFLSGPPGTGKTTTLVKRIGQKLDLDALDPEEARAIRETHIDGSQGHRQSWVMFSPTELLRLYVKEAFVKEGVPASNDHIRTWTKYSRELGRDILSLLRTSSGSGAFILRETGDYLPLPTRTEQAGDWFDAFNKYFLESFFVALQEDANHLSQSDRSIVATIGEKLRELIDGWSADAPFELLPDLASLDAEVAEASAELSEANQKALRLSLNTLLHADRDFIQGFGVAASQIHSSGSDGDDLPDEVGDDEVEETEQIVPIGGRPLTDREAANRYFGVIRSAGRAAFTGRKLSPTSVNGQLLQWIGHDRMPAKEVLQDIGKNTVELGRLRRFTAIHSGILRSVPKFYRAFRRSQKDVWYSGEPVRSSDVAWPELDLLILASLRATSQMIRAFRARRITFPTSGLFGKVAAEYKNQVLVDEATDFSLMQLACMYELSNPALRSFFACGDFNQRLTLWGITRESDLDWIARGIERRRISTSYRQTGKLVNFAKEVARLGGADDTDAILPDRVDQDGVPPVWLPMLDDHKKVAKWIAERLREVEANVRTLPTVAVLVHDESDVEPLAKELSAVLEDMNIAAAACREGEIVGDDRDVRVFSLKHIKGMEFEAVFFVDLDEMVADMPELYAKYLYVGATRAATYLGATLKRDVPAELMSLADHFQENWSS